ncbi:TetR family transcriptional regulator [[Mycobacterium] chelonae subsp. gwanakae]|uniref:TetR family transcriptional regulator n=1 Tax=Mycobacteroides chelonae TaxID=1774 RepID=A0AB73TY95_MYCCH|nr:TetR family transcriptional regulator [[Mycobacterium] chelonae subsp. gwanakae]QDF69514.1 TetR family transcriptional regulator [Mycobacteroides chelonae]
MEEQPRGRRAEVIAAAIEVAGTMGVGGLTYRSVDAAANVPSGTTSNHFRTRDALLLGVIVEIEKLRRAFWRALVTEINPTTVADLVGIGTAYANGAVGMMSTRVRAYMALLMEGWSHPELREPLQRGRDAQIPRTLQLMRKVDPKTPELHAEIFQDYLTGIIYQQLANPSPNFNPRPGIEALLTRLVTPQAAQE